MSLLIALVAGVAIGLSLGTLGAGGSVLAVPVLVFGLHESPLAATTGSLVVVGVTAAVGAFTAYRQGHVRLDQGLTFGAAAIGGAVAGSRAAVHVPSAVLMAAFSTLLVVVAVVMVVRRVRGGAEAGAEPWSRTVVRLRPFTCDCPRAARVLVAATLVGLLTGFLGVGGGFLVVPALVLALGMPMRQAAGTSLVVISVTTLAALLARLGSAGHPDWGPVLLLTAAAATAAVVGSRWSGRVPAAALQTGFAGLMVLVAGYTAWQAVPGLA